jgi:hypothetical protein
LWLGHRALHRFGWPLHFIRSRSALHINSTFKFRLVVVDHAAMHFLFLDDEPSPPPKFITASATLPLRKFYVKILDEEIEET